jgi:hypothetical protein
VVANFKGRVIGSNAVNSNEFVTLSQIGGLGTGTVTSVAALTLGTTGTDLSSTVANSTTTPVITLNVPTASATNRGALSAADWTTFNNKTSNVGTVTSVGLSSATSGVTIGSTPVTTSGTITLAIATASGSQNGLLSSTDWSTFNGKVSSQWITSGSNIYYNTGSVSIGTASVGNFSAIGFTGPFFDVAGVIQIKGTSANGIAPIQFGGDTFRKAIIYSSIGTETPHLTFATASSGSSSSAQDQMRIFSDGNVLIQSGGTFTNAGFKLDVNGTGRFSDTITYSNANNKNVTSTSGATTGFIYSNFTNSGNSLYWGVENSAGNGIGWTGGPLAYSAFFGSTDNRAVHLMSNSAVRFTITGGGNVGIGTTSPSTILQANFSNSSSYSSGVTGNGLMLYNTSTTNNQYVGLYFLGEPAAGNAGQATIYGITTGSGAMDMSFSTRGSSVLSERMRITSGGNVLIGTSTDNGSKLQVSGRLSFYGTAYNLRSVTTITNNNLVTISDTIVANSTGFIVVMTAGGRHWIPFYGLGGAGVGYYFTILNPSTGSWIVNEYNPTITIVTNGSNSVSITVNLTGGGGEVKVQQSSGTANYTIEVYIGSAPL